eukprot:TRINITY_DN34346_c0_g1_i1.p1 TRINITY_DN34346_c0_g1~~TRINITY_DN34346_c0_g1_i1.p1  ORF type:complete len:519 (-),score=82.75 TRINITY_DN34346_c0_g1_i1:109-1614(-)
MALPRIAICGAGISGLNLGGILSRRLGAAGRIAVFERAASDRDQGYGLDLNKHGQEALARAGVYGRFWEIARPRSDAGTAFFQASSQGPDARPTVFIYAPRWMQRHFRTHVGARPECNREKLRDILLDALKERGTTVHFNTKAADIREVPAADGGLSAAELFDQEGRSLGEFDLVVDAMGLHSTLRQHYVDDPLGKHFGGMVMIHGSINDPEASFSPQLMARFAPYGTTGVMCRKGHFFMQRYGASAEDNRTSIFYVISREDGEDGVFAELGLDTPSSREGGIMRDSDRLDRVKSWIKRDMGDDFCPIWKEAVDHMDRVTVRNDVTHGDTELRPNVTMPLICIGDSLRNCGLGGGGILALEDTIELAKVLLPDDGEGKSPAFNEETGRVDPAVLRRAAEVMLARKNKHAAEKRKLNGMFLNRRERDGKGVDFTWEDFREQQGWGPVKNSAMRLLLPLLQARVERWYANDLARGEAGSTKENAIVYKNVTDYLERQSEAKGP